MVCHLENAMTFSHGTKLIFYLGNDWCATLLHTYKVLTAMCEKNVVKSILFAT